MYYNNIKALSLACVKVTRPCLRLNVPHRADPTPPNFASGPITIHLLTSTSAHAHATIAPADANAAAGDA